MVYRSTIFILATILFSSYSCEKENESEDTTYFIIQDTSAVTDTSIIIDGAIIGQRINIDTLGVFYQQYGSTYSNRISFGSRTSPGKFHMEIHGLNPFTTYFYQVYAISKNGKYQFSHGSTIFTNPGGGK